MVGPQLSPHTRLPTQLRPQFSSTTTITSSHLTMPQFPCSETSKTPQTQRDFPTSESEQPDKEDDFDLFATQRRVAHRLMCCDEVFAEESSSANYPEVRKRKITSIIRAATANNPSPAPQSREQEQAIALPPQDPPEISQECSQVSVTQYHCNSSGPGDCCLTFTADFRFIALDATIASSCRRDDEY